MRHDPLDDEQMAFVFEEIETGIEEIKAGLEARDKSGATPRPSRPRKGFAPHLERIEQVIEPEVPADCVDLEAIRIGEDVSERLDVTQDTFRIIVTAAQNMSTAWLMARAALWRHRRLTT